MSGASRERRPQDSLQDERGAQRQRMDTPLTLEEENAALRARIEQQRKKLEEHLTCPISKVQH